jgi:LSD1 subclass zinc finger protein
MRKLSAFTAEEMSDFCGACHRTWSQIATGGPRGILNVRFQPYRLALSKCYDAEDRRIRCTACHDPHRPLETNAGAYDVRCQACHASTAKRVCKTGTRDCVSCHMPALELPGAHKKFTDHRIRIARAGEPYPD